MDEATAQKIANLYHEMEVRKRIISALTIAGKYGQTLRLHIIDIQGAKYDEVTLTSEIRECLLGAATNELDLLKHQMEAL